MRERGRGDCARPEWLESRTDPVRDSLRQDGQAPDLETIAGLFPRPQGETAFDGEVIAGNIERLRTEPEVCTGHPLLDKAVKTGLAFIDATFQGDHPKYGIRCYGQTRHDGFPPTIIATVDALSAWGLGARAAQLFRYWLHRFVRADGSIDYYGTSVAEYGQLLHTAALLYERHGPKGWWQEASGATERMAERLLRLHASARSQSVLISGSPEADERDRVGSYFHNNAWTAKGLRRWAALCEQAGHGAATPSQAVLAAAEERAADTFAAICRTWPADPADWWLPPQTESVERPGSLTATRLASYTNYRYWPELLASGLLPDDMANRLVDARLSAGGQFCGMTRFADWLDDWPLADYLYGLHALGRHDDFLLSLFGHVAYHQAEGHMTAYEQVTFPPGREKAAFCLPCQLVAVRAARLLVP